MATVFVPDHSDPNAVILPIIYLKQCRFLAHFDVRNAARSCLIGRLHEAGDEVADAAEDFAGKVFVGNRPELLIRHDPREQSG